MNFKIMFLCLVTCIPVIFSCNPVLPEENGAWIVSDTSLRDPDGNTYPTVTIGNLVWTVENLKTTKYNDGSAIPLVSDSGESDGSTGWRKIATDAFCYFDNNEANKAKYGALYNWDAVNTGKLAPNGWRIPSDADWTSLSEFLGGASVAGGKMKHTDTTDWKAPNAGATNSSGFSALPGGYRDYNGRFQGLKGSTIWWSSTLFQGNTAYYRSLSNLHQRLEKADGSIHVGCSVRLVRDR